MHHGFTNSTGLGWAGLGWAGQGRAGQGRAGQGRAGQGRAGQGRAGQGRAGQETDHALEKNFLHFESSALLFMLLPSKVVSRCSWESNQATCQSGEWEEPEKQETYTHRRKHSTMNIILSFFHSYILVFIGRNNIYIYIYIYIYMPLGSIGQGFYSTYFLIPKKDGGLRPILNLRKFNHNLKCLPFRILCLSTLLTDIRQGDWFTTVDLQDAYFHIPIHKDHKKYLRFYFQGNAYEYNVLPFGLSLAPLTFTKCMNMALIPLR